MELETLKEFLAIILHASDLHFGKSDPAVVELFYKEIERQKPDLVVLSGDFTQVGSKREFKMARDFIARITAPVFTVPGNHDISRFNTWNVFSIPCASTANISRRCRISCTIYKDCFIVGINTARPISPH